MITLKSFGKLMVYTQKLVECYTKHLVKAKKLKSTIQNLKLRNECHLIKDNKEFKKPIQRSVLVHKKPK